MTLPLLRVFVAGEEALLLTDKGEVLFRTSDPVRLKLAMGVVGRACEAAQAEALDPGSDTNTRVGALTSLTHLTLLLGAVLNELRHLERNAARPSVFFLQAANQERN